MKFEILREAVLKPLQMVSGVVEKKQTLPILSNILINLDQGKLTITATDLEMEVIATTQIDSTASGSTTVPVRKFMDTCKTLADDSLIKFVVDNNKAILTSKKTRFSLTTMPAEDFPVIDTKSQLFGFKIKQKDLKRLIDKTSFAMAFQDVRFYLNGLLFEITPHCIKTVATDGHRLAICSAEVETGVSDESSIIIPRKGVLEIARLLEDSNEEIEVIVGENFIRVIFSDVTFTSKLVDGKYPNYDSVIPKNTDKQIHADKTSLRQCLIRTSILSNEKYRGIKLAIRSGYLKATANNPDHEEAEDETPIDYDGETVEIGFNVNYLLDAITALDTDTVELNITDSNGSTLVKAVDDESCQYVVMPMRL
ncbi:MAG: DNA polymerase III subunit beta [Gammaproteobacteria bacterium]|nr:DNA polymerase III subunit beta [Gammaproteobacteria bacterium]